MVRNHFLDGEEAEHYDRSRPYFHPLVFSRLREILHHPPLALSLDIACGTGQSTEALAGISGASVGLDASAAMLKEASRRGLPCVQGLAEKLPFADEQFDLVAIGLAFHWFDRVAVLKEARRVLRAGRWLLIYTSGFRGTMEGQDGFGVWNRAYLERFPTPARHSTPLPAEAFEAAGFSQIASERFRHSHAYTREQLIAYLMTQTNVTAAIASGSETREGIRKWLASSLAPFFGDNSTGTFDYEGALSLLETTG